KARTNLAFVRAFRVFRGLYFFSTDQILHGMLFLRNRLRPPRYPEGRPPEKGILFPDHRLV
ncbi:MAG: hypothetical protein WCI11_17560, partial [Candidatus Methylumidiphilus sp.]